MRQVLFMRLQTKLFHPGLGDLGDVIRPQGTSNKTLELNMYSNDHGVFVEGKGLTLFIPNGNIQFTVVGPEIVLENKAHVKKTNPSPVSAVA